MASPNEAVIEFLGGDPNEKIVDLILRKMNIPQNSSVHQALQGIDYTASEVLEQVNAGVANQVFSLNSQLDGSINLSLRAPLPVTRLVKWANGVVKIVPDPDVGLELDTRKNLPCFGEM